MKSAILVESKKPLVVAEIDLPAKLEFGQVLVKVCYSGICGAQINEIEAVKGPDKFLLKPVRILFLLANLFLPLPTVFCFQLILLISLYFSNYVLINKVYQFLPIVVSLLRLIKVGTFFL
jgi:hypothetical protein